MDETVYVLDGSTYLISDRRGDVVAGSPHGLFYRDTRHLSQWELLLDGRSLAPVQAVDLEYDEALFVLAEQTGTVYRDAELSVVRFRRVGGGVQETITVTNDSRRSTAVTLSLLFDADFADLFDVKDQKLRHQRRPAVVRQDVVQLSYERDDFHRRTTLRAPGARLTPRTIELAVMLDPQQSATLDVEIEMHAGARTAPLRRSRQPNMQQSLQEWLDAAPDLRTDWDTLHHTYRRSLIDLAALRFYPDAQTGGDAGAGGSVPAAGLPWFMALFGRDSLITSYLALPYLPELARTSLRVLAARQATTVDDFRDAQPGKILHELRHGEDTWFGERPQSPYYGSADATPLFLVVLDEYHRWTGDDALVRELEQPARAALTWVEQYGDTNGDGYVDYLCRNRRTGIENQCWKDSGNSIVHPDGTLAVVPRAPCELQGYAYDARLRTARLARECWADPELATRLEQDAAQLRTRFNRDYWVEEGGWFALALDGEGHRVRTLASNMGQLLWSGIVETDRVGPVVDHLMSKPLFSGWGVRTLATGQAAFNPFGYHVGSVWPHDNALIAAGLARYGQHEQADRIAAAMIEAAGHLGHRLPEALAGQSRSDTHQRPVRYPTAASPQAWASATPLAMLSVLLRLQPTVHSHEVPDQLCFERRS